MDGDGIPDEYLDQLLDFYNVLVHSILHARGVYPPEMFEDSRHPLLRTMPVKVSRHPEVVKYVHDTVEDLRWPIKEGSVRRITLELCQEDTLLVMERYILEMGLWSKTRPSSRARQAEQTTFDAFQGILVKLLQSLPRVPDIPACALTFRIVATGPLKRLDGKYDEWIRADAAEESANLRIVSTKSTVLADKSEGIPIQLISIRGLSSPSGGCNTCDEK
mmetsp:Transcript_27554/g.76988  ORF Transcript_27554/g.76988 Transcript_27554/m.76988 type:complete len:219 (+) Transcript_27554:423-1079(+)